MMFPYSFSLVETETDRDLAFFNSVQGLAGENHAFVDGIEYHKIHFLNCSILDSHLKHSTGSVRFPIEIGNLTVRMLNKQKETIVEYHITDGRVLNLINISDIGSDIELIGSIVDIAKPFEEVLRDVWINGVGVKNQWSELGHDLRRAWLHIVRKHYRFNGIHIEDKPKNSIYELDGSYISDFPSFFIALGEAINGPGGYFGNCFTSLRDCLCGGFGATTPFTLIWKKSNVARVALDKESHIAEILENRQDTLREINGPELDELLSISEIKDLQIETLYEKIINFLGKHEKVQLILEE